MKKITRRAALYSFFKTILMLSPGLSLFVFACNTDETGNGNGNGCPSAGDGGNCTGSGTDITICSNHGHTMSLTAIQITNEVEGSYPLTIGNGHTHTVFLTAAYFDELQANRGIKITSSVDSGHNHDVVINCM